MRKKNCSLPNKALTKHVLQLLLFRIMCGAARTLCGSKLKIAPKSVAVMNSICHSLPLTRPRSPRKLIRRNDYDRSHPVPACIGRRAEQHKWNWICMLCARGFSDAALHSEHRLLCRSISDEMAWNEMNLGSWLFYAALRLHHLDSSIVVVFCFCVYLASLIATNLTFIVFELFDMTWMNWVNNGA